MDKANCPSNYVRIAGQRWKARNDMTNQELYMRKLVRESDVIDKTDGSELAQAFNTLWDKYVEAEPCEDTINRQAALDYIYNDLGLGDEENGKDLERQMELEDSYKYIKSLPPVTPKHRWIPVSERLPEDRDWYLGIFKEPDTGWVNPLPFICDYVGSETKATTKEHWILRGFTDRDVRDCDYYFNLECVAWMPLPEPYKPESEG